MLCTPCVSRSPPHQPPGCSYGCQAKVLRERSTAADGAAFCPGSSPIIAHFGPWKHYNPITKEFDITTPAHGFLPLKWYGPGMMDILSGQLTQPELHENRLAVK
jgi:hypothetical protein